VVVQSLKQLGSNPMVGPEMQTWLDAHIHALQCDTQAPVVLPVMCAQSNGAHSLASLQVLPPESAEAGWTQSDGKQPEIVVAISTQDKPAPQPPEPEHVLTQLAASPIDDDSTHIDSIGQLPLGQWDTQSPVLLEVMCWQLREPQSASL
jgi:hypothetical protein